MAKIEKLIPHILKWEVGLRPNELNLSPRQMYEAVMQRGFHIIAGDSGGATMCGVTIGTFTDWRKRHGKGTPTVNDLRALRYDEWIAILKETFWNPCKADLIRNQSVANMLVDWRWVNGTQAVRDTQTAFSLVADGVVGSKTLGALNGSDARTVFNRLKSSRERSYHRIVERRPSQKKFLQGWLNRTNDIEFEQ